MKRPPCGGTGANVRHRETSPTTFIVEHREAELPQVALTVHAPGRLTSGLHGRQQQADERANDGNHHQEFNQREPPHRIHNGVIIFDQGGIDRIVVIMIDQRCIDRVVVFLLAVATSITRQWLLFVETIHSLIVVSHDISLAWIAWIEWMHESPGRAAGAHGAQTTRISTRAITTAPPKMGVHISGWHNNQLRRLRRHREDGQREMRAGTPRCRR